MPDDLDDDVVQALGCGEIPHRLDEPLHAGGVGPLVERYGDRLRQVTQNKSPARPRSVVAWVAETYAAQTVDGVTLYDLSAAPSTGGAATTA